METFYFWIGSALLSFALGAASQYTAFKIALMKSKKEWERKLAIERDNVNALEKEKRWLAEELVK